MNNNITGIIVSFVFIFLLIGISTALSNNNFLSKEASRKLIHIGVSNWWIIAMYFFKDMLWASIMPIIFIILNYISYKLNVIKAMERGGGRGDLGTVYFPISLLVLVLLTFNTQSHPYVGALGILIMGYGDGFAAIIGKSYGSKKIKLWGSEKSYTGSITMFIASFIVAVTILYIFSPENILFKSLIIAGFSTLVELISPFGTDNLTVPILTSLLYQLFFF